MSGNIIERLKDVIVYKIRYCNYDWDMTNESGFVKYSLDCAGTGWTGARFSIDCSFDALPDWFPEQVKKYYICTTLVNSSFSNSVNEFEHVFIGNNEIGYWRVIRDLKEIGNHIGYQYCFSANNSSTSNAEYKSQIFIRINLYHPTWYNCPWFERIE